MNQMDRAMPSTSYLGEVAYEYDEQRFVSRQGRLFSSMEFEQLERAVRGLENDSRVLEVGCGTARFSQHLARQGFSVMATDPSPDMIEVARRKCSDLKTIAFQQEEGGQLSFPDASFDFVFAIRVLNQTGSEVYALRMVSEMIRVARGGGRVLIEFANSGRPCARRSKSVRLSFEQIEETARVCDCEVLSRHGVLVFSQSLLDAIPGPLVPVWGMVERLASWVVWRWASRGYVLLRKR